MCFVSDLLFLRSRFLFFRIFVDFQVTPAPRARMGSTIIDVWINVLSVFNAFSKPPLGTCLQGPSADLVPTCRFWFHFRFSGFPKSHLLATIFAQNIDLELPSGRPKTILAATLLFLKP